MIGLRICRCARGATEEAQEKGSVTQKPPMGETVTMKVSAGHMASPQFTERKGE